LPDALILTEAGRLPPRPVWGGDGGRPAAGPDEALGWLTLVRLLGWSATVAAGWPAGAEPRIAILTGRSDEHPLDALRAAQPRRPMLVVAAPGAAGGELARWAGVARRAAPEPPAGSPRRLAWLGPGPPAAWTTPDAPLRSEPLELDGDVAVWATLGGEPAIAARRVAGIGVIATLGLDVGDARAAGGAATALLKRLLTCGCPFPTAWLDLAGALLLRMDDPGASASVHLRSWSYAKLGEPEWEAVGAALRVRGARLSVAYTPAWVDDGDARRGTLEVAGAPVARAAGAVHPSPLVTYVDRAGHAPGRIDDYRAEHRGVATLEAAGLVGVEQHGYTHMPSDLSGWSRAPDRYDDVAWYREFDADPVLPAAEHPVALGASLLREHFLTPPTTLVCPGQAWTDGVLAHALAAGLRLVSADGLALRDDDRFCWCAGVPAVYLDKPDPGHLESELPAIGFFHDYEPAVIGPDWMGTQLDAWRRAGARRLMDFRELAAALELRLDLEPAASGWRLVARGDREPPLPRPLPVLLHVPGGEPPAWLELPEGRRKVQRLGDGLGRLVLPGG